MRNAYRAIEKAGIVASIPWLSPMVKVKVVESEVDVYQRGKLKWRRVVTLRRSPNTLSPISRCRISMNGASEACSPEWLCTQSSGWRRLEDNTTKKYMVAREKGKKEWITLDLLSLSSPGIA
jgi:hypothetical protein